MTPDAPVDARLPQRRGDEAPPGRAQQDVEEPPGDRKAVDPVGEPIDEARWIGRDEGRRPRRATRRTFRLWHPCPHDGAGSGLACRPGELNDGVSPRSSPRLGTNHTLLAPPEKTI